MKSAPAALALLALPLLVSSTACSSASSAGVRPGVMAVELGTGTWQFEPVTDGETIPLVHGAQGGWHFWVAARVTGTSAESGSLTIERQPADESLPPSRATIGIHLDPPDAEGARNFLGYPEILSDPSCTVGVMTRVRLTLVLADGTSASDERIVIPGPGDSPPPPCAR